MLTVFCLTGLFSFGSVEISSATLIKQLSESLQVSSYHKIYLFTKSIKLFAKQLLPISIRCNPFCDKNYTLILLLSI